MFFNKIATYIIFGTIALAPTSAFAQNSFHLSVFDAESGSPIQNAFVTELNSGQTVSTDVDGNCEFPVPFPSGTTTAIEIFALGYPSQYREFDLASSTEPINDYRPLYLYASNQFLSSPIGPAGGQKVFANGTGQIVTDQAGVPIKEYVQEMKATVPQGALFSPIRIGFTPINQSAWNVLYAARDLPQNWRVGAQCQVSVFDLNGIEIASPLLAQSIRLEIDPGLYFDHGNLTGWTARAYHFDEVLMQWSSAGISESGIGKDGKLWADLSILQNVTFMLIPPSTASQKGKSDGVTCWWEYAAPRDFNSIDGAIFFSQPTDCPTGTQAPVDISSEGEHSGQIETEWATALGNNLTKLAGRLEGGSSDTSRYSHKRKLMLNLPRHSYPSWDGKIMIREAGLVFERTQWCWDEITGAVEYLDIKESRFIVTGAQIFKYGKPCE